MKKKNFPPPTAKHPTESQPAIHFRVKPRNQIQKDYLQTISDNVLTFGLGPAGTGKTFLAVAAAVQAYLDGHMRRIILIRPAVEAGEKLGFLPGSLQEKVDPYLRPLYDALYEMLPSEKVRSMLEDGTIEAAPLAFLRGRTLRNSFIIMDEAQNTTSEQLKMFLTRLGDKSRVVVTGDPTQVDLPRGTRSGLVEAVRILAQVQGIGFCRFTEADVIRHPLVQLIVRAYEAEG